MNDIALLGCFFNPNNSKNRIRNIKYFLKFIDECGLGEDTYLCEILFDGQESILGDRKNVLVLHTTSILWHKESAYNILWKSLPSNYTKVIFCDTDIIWKNKNWWKIISELLENNNMVHGFSSFYKLQSPDDIDLNKLEVFDSSDVCYSTIKNYFKTNLASMKMGATCGIYGYKIEFLNKLGGLYDKCLVGGGDNINTPFITYNDRFFDYINLREDMIDFKNKLLHLVNNKFTYLDEPCFHLYHGSHENRQYFNRHNILMNVNFGKCFTKDSNGLWKCVDPDLQNKIIRYFIIRQEDDSISKTYISNLNIYLYNTSMYYVETSNDDRTFVWMRPQFNFKIKNVKNIKFYFDRFNNVHCSDEMEVKLNGSVYKSGKIKNTEILDIELDNHIEYDIEFNMNKYFVPREICDNSNDNRQLSIALINVEYFDGDDKHTRVDLSELITVKNLHE